MTNSATLNSLIPMPVSVTSTGGTFALNSSTNIYIDQSAPSGVAAIGQYLAEKLNRSTGFGLRVSPSANPGSGNIFLSLQGGDSTLGDEGYDLSITPQSVTLRAYKPAGLFRGIQTIRQLLPPEIESTSVQVGPWTMPTAVIRDYPRFGWRGAMLDVARHFFKPDEVKRIIDLLAYYKLNVFHLHLTDDQGWRIMINSWPKLATYGGNTAVDGASGGYYTQAEYADLLAYAQNRYITIVPEIDMPGHTNAALASYAELNCNDTAPAQYTGIKVGFSSLCIGKEITFKFIDDVIGEIAALTPGPYIHVGGDESSATSDADYLTFVERVQAIVSAHGKQTVGWGEIAQGKLLKSTIVQHWRDEVAQKAVQQGAKIIMSPASKAYLDMKYDADTTLGMNWAGFVGVETAYQWDPATHLNGVSEGDVLGIEAALWTETIQNMADIEYMFFPRILGYAEIGWSPASDRTWDEYRIRLSAHESRLTAMGVNFYRSAGITLR